VATKIEELIVMQNAVTEIEMSVAVGSNHD
jgi:hypothetical protein